MQHKKPITIVFTGPESTAKSTVSQRLSQQMGALWVPEYAREYIESLNRPYTYEDVEMIAMQQKESYQEALKTGRSIVIFDTFLIITKVWFMEVYGKMPRWIERMLQDVHIDLHLLCYPDIRWIADGVRENEQNRKYLFDIYRFELEKYNFAYEVIKGEGEERIQEATKHITHFLKFKQ